MKVIGDFWGPVRVPLVQKLRSEITNLGASRILETLDNL